MFRKTYPKELVYRKRRKSPLRRFALLVAAFVVMSPALARLWLYANAQSRIYTNVKKVPKCRAALVLGAKVMPSGNPSALLALRLDKAIELYKAGRVDKLLMSGDNRFTHYNEPKRMKDYAVAHGVPAEDVVEDFAGRRTYDSVYRAKHIFGQDRIVIVTQGFHIDRALYLARKLRVDAYGVPAEMRPNYRATIREFVACLGAIADTHLRRPKPVLGKPEKL